MNRRESAFLVIGLGLGLLLSLAVMLEVMLSLRDGAKLSGFGFDKIVFLIPAILLTVGTVLLGYRKKADRN